VSPALRTARSAALAVIALLVVVATVASFGESYRGLLLWSEHHGLHGIWAAAFPLQVDVFLGVGETALFIAMTDRWSRRDRAGAWLVTIAGLAVSVAGNVGHAGAADWTSRATAAIPPLAAAAALAVGLGVVKRVVAGMPSPEPSPRPAAQPVPVVESGNRQPRQHRQAGKGKRTRQQTTMTPAEQDAAVMGILQRAPATSKAELARALNLSERTVSRAIERITTPAQPPELP
jgi:DNA-binding CsgD family transcriptional regulator